jgi:hypothetical protein
MRLIDGLAPDMRSLFEKVLSVMPAEVSRPIWDRYVEFEHTMVSSGGDLATVAKIEARRAMAFPDEPFVEMKGLLSIAHRYAFLDLRPPTTCIVRLRPVLTVATEVKLGNEWVEQDLEVALVWTWTGA